MLAQSRKLVAINPKAQSNLMRAKVIPLYSCQPYFTKIRNRYVLDYKTGGAPKNYENDFQTMIYLLAVSDFFKTYSLKFVYLDLKNRTDKVVEFSEESAKKYTDRLKDYVTKINSGSFKPICKRCKYCEYKVICNEKLLD